MGMTAPTTPPAGGRARLIRWYGIGVAAGVALLAAAVAWGVFGGDITNTLDLGSPTTSSSGVATAAPTSPGPSPTAPGEAVDANLAFTVTAVNTAATVTSATNELLSKDAGGQFIIVSLEVRNVGDETSYYLSNQQKLQSGSDSYEADAAASSYLGSLYEELSPGDEVDTVLVFDVPPGTVPDAIEVHGDAVAAGTDIPLQ